MKKILFLLSVFTLQQSYAAKVSLHAVPSVVLEASSPEKTEIDTHKLFEAIDEEEAIRANGWTLLLRVKSLPKDVETLKVARSEDASIQSQCSDVKVTETSRITGETYIDVLYTVNYDLSGDDGANYCAVTAQQAGVKKTVRFGFNIGD